MSSTLIRHIRESLWESRNHKLHCLQSWPGVLGFPLPAPTLGCRSCRCPGKVFVLGRQRWLQPGYRCRHRLPPRPQLGRLGKGIFRKGGWQGVLCLGKNSWGGVKIPWKKHFYGPPGCWPRLAPQLCRHWGGSAALPPPHSAVFWGAEAGLGFPQSLVTSATSAWCVGKSGVTRPAACGCGTSARNAGRSSPWVRRDGTGTANGAGGGQEGCA